MMSCLATPRRALLLIAALSLVAVGIALVSQYVFDMPPCAWCVLQRLIYLIMAALALLGAWLEARSRRNAKPHTVMVTQVLLVACLVTAGVGVAAAWYQHTVAAQLFSCDMTFADRFMTRTGLEAALPFLFGIYATCMDAAVTVLGVEYAVWSLLLYGVLGGVAAVGLCLSVRQN